MRLLLLALVMAGLVGAGLLGMRYLPPEWDPRAPLDLRAEPNLLTQFKLTRAARDPQACFAAFSHSGLRVSRVPDRPMDGGCGLDAAVRLPSLGRVTPPDPVVTCGVALAWAMFERHSLQPAARAHLSAEVTGVRHLGTYACRNVNHAAEGRRSEHATANAIDISAFTLSDGREVRVMTGWAPNTPSAAFLRAARDGACRWFRAVLGPDYNAAHADHFHFDMGPWRACR